MMTPDVTLGDLAVAYREDYLNVHEGTTGDLSRQGGMLAVEEVRRHLAESALPRLVTEGVLQPPVPTDPHDTTTFLTLTLPPDGHTHEEKREQLLALARDLVHLAEPSVEQPAAWEGSVLTGRGLTKSYRRRTVVSDVDLSLKQGEIVGLLGPNGAGKTTTFYMIVGLVRPDSGDIMIDGHTIHRLPMYRRARLGIGYLAQEPSIFRKLTVEQNVLAVLETLKLSNRERRERLERLLDELTIKHLRKVPAYQLSGGERRRLEITRALVTQPRFMLLDEPFAGVDPIAVHDIQTIVAGLRKRGIGVLITDHNVEQTLDIVDRAYIMFEGKVQVGGTVKELVMDDRVADLYLGPTLTARLRERLGVAV
jgi:lipopolysaccharide export system ATP-binding protein